MNKLILLIVLLFPTVCFANVFSQEQGFNGYLFVRLTNQLPRPVVCYVSGQYGEYYTFWVYPGRTSGWYRLRGLYQWGCQ